ncbi:MAG: CHAT domain-containing tetratricopeptide repeat protein [Bacteroidota bacterium]
MSYQKTNFPIGQFFPLLFLGIFLSSVVFSQDSLSLQNSLLQEAEALLQKGIDLTETNLDSSLFYKKAALPIFEKSGHWERYISCLNSIVYIYYYQGAYEQANANAELAFKKASAHLDENNQVYSDVINNLSVFLEQKGDYEKATQYYQKSLDIQKRVNFDKAAVAASYHNLGQVYRSKGDVEEAINYFKQALELRLDTFGIAHLEVARNHLVLGNCYREKHDWQAALSLYRQCLQIVNLPSIKQGARNDQVKISAFQNIAEVKSQSSQNDSVIYYINLALALQPEDASYRKSRSYEVLGRIQAELGNYPATISNLEEAKRLAKISYKAYDKHRVFSNLSFLIGQAYAQQSNFKAALSSFQMALEEVSFDFDGQQMTSNPQIDQIYAKSQALDILESKTQVLDQLHRRNPGETDWLLQAYQSYQLATAIIQDLRENFSATASKYLLAGKALPIYENAIHTALSLHRQTKKREYLNEAFAFAESNKAVLLLAVLKENVAKGFGGIPDSLLQQEKDLKLRLSFYEEKISNAKRRIKATDKAKLKIWEDTRFNLRETYKQLVKSFEKDYPKYYQLKYDNRPLQIQQFQAKLPINSLAIEYFVGEKQIFIFSISPDDLQVDALAYDQHLLQSTEYLRRYISVPPATNNAAAQLDSFAILAFDLYQNLLEPALAIANPELKQLIIIPDDFLSYIPFDVLLTRSPEGMNKVLEMDAAYLVQQYAVNYHYSANLFLKQQPLGEKNDRQSFAGFAPAFKGPKMALNSDNERACESSELYSLSCNDTEVETIQSLLKGSAYLSSIASKESFLNVINQTQIIHLATHACVDDVDPMLSKIYFNDDHLSSYDLYNLKVNADLAVLSACNTGSGKLVKGEGVLSLARGFIHAGCPSVLMSLWSVDDCATSDIMQEFYLQLIEGQNKDEALRLAKVKYLKEADRLHMHPYFWSAFVQVGDAEALVFEYGWGGVGPLVIGLGVVLLMLGWWRFGG